jgi:hypothetical protein
VLTSALLTEHDFSLLTEFASEFIQYLLNLPNSNKSQNIYEKILWQDKNLYPQEPMLHHFFRTQGIDRAAIAKTYKKRASRQTPPVRVSPATTALSLSLSSPSTPTGTPIGSQTHPLKKRYPENPSHSFIPLL